MQTKPYRRLQYLPPISAIEYMFAGEKDTEREILRENKKEKQSTERVFNSDRIKYISNVPLDFSIIVLMKSCGSRQHARACKLITRNTCGFQALVNNAHLIGSSYIDFFIDGKVLNTIDCKLVYFIQYSFTA